MYAPGPSCPGKDKTVQKALPLQAKGTSKISFLIESPSPMLPVLYLAV